MNVLIPSRENISATSQEDPALFYYRPLIGNFYLKRLKMALGLIDKDNKKDRVIEIGYGCGILLLELCKRFRAVFATDIHSNGSSIREMLTKEGVSSILTTADIRHLSYKAESFDCVICLSVLEHVDNLGYCIDEMIRIAKPEGQIIFGIPIDNVFMALAFRLLGYKVQSIHKWSHVQIAEQIKDKTTVEKIVRFPDFLTSSFSMYIVLACRKKIG